MGGAGETDGAIEQCAVAVLAALCSAAPRHGEGREIQESAEPATVALAFGIGFWRWPFWRCFGQRGPAPWRGMGEARRDSSPSSPPRCAASRRPSAPSQRAAGGVGSESESFVFGFLELM